MELIAPQVHNGSHLVFRSMDFDWSVLFFGGTITASDIIMVDPLEAGIGTHIDFLLTSDQPWLRYGYKYGTKVHTELSNMWKHGQKLALEYINAEPGKATEKLGNGPSIFADIGIMLSASMVLESQARGLGGRFSNEELDLRGTW